MQATTTRAGPTRRRRQRAPLPRQRTSAQTPAQKQKVGALAGRFAAAVALQLVALGAHPTHCACRPAPPPRAHTHRLPALPAAYPAFINNSQPTNLIPLTPPLPSPRRPSRAGR